MVDSTASKFTVVVNSTPVKPVKGKDKGSILIPLLVGLHSGAANEGGSIRASVEISYFTTHTQPLGGVNGTIGLSPPQFDLPITWCYPVPTDTNSMEILDPTNPH